MYYRPHNDSMLILISIDIGENPHTRTIQSGHTDLRKAVQNFGTNQPVPCLYDQHAPCRYGRPAPKI